MSIDPQPNPSGQPNASTSRPILFLTARLLGIRPPSVGISIRGPDEDADNMPAQPPLGGVQPPKMDINEQPGNPPGGIKPIVNRD